MRTLGFLSIGRVLIRCLLLVALVFRGGVAGAQSAWHEVPAGDAHQSGRFENPNLVESSGVAVSRRYPGVLWSLNDSGNPAWFFATDTLGRDRGTFAVTGATNFDWEALALARCGSSDCLYIGDTGDNRQARSSVRLYRVPEPRPSSRAGDVQATAAAEKLEVRYPDGPHDVEALYVDQVGDSYLITKGASGSVSLYRIPSSAWKVGHALARPLARLPIDAAWLGGTLVTDAALAPGGQRVAVRTYQTVFLFRRAPDGGLMPEEGHPACSVANLEAQGEGIAWLDHRTLVLTSEGAIGYPGTVSLARCPPDVTQTQPR
jgi:hypothetical protein